MAGISTQGFKLSYKVGEGAYTVLNDCMGIPELGGTRDKIEVTTLDSTAHEYINGLENYGDSIEFQFIYVEEQYDALYALEGIVDWKVEHPLLENTWVFSGESSVRMDASNQNDKILYTLSITPNSAIEKVAKV